MKETKNSGMAPVVTITSMFLLSLSALFANLMVTNRTFSIGLIMACILIALGSVTVGVAIYMSLSDIYWTIKEVLMREIGFVTILTILYFILNTHVSMWNFYITDDISVKSHYFMLGLLLLLSSPILSTLQRCQKDDLRTTKYCMLETTAAAIMAAIIFFFTERLPLQFTFLYITAFAVGFFYTACKSEFSKGWKICLKAISLGIPLTMLTLIATRNRLYIYTRLKTAWTYNSANNGYWGSDYRVLYNFIGNWKPFSGIPDRTITYDVDSFLQWKTNQPIWSIAYFTGWSGAILYIILVLALFGTLTFILSKMWKQKKSNHVTTVMAISIIQGQLLLSLISAFFPLVNVPAILSTDTFFIIDNVLLGIILGDICGINRKLDFLIAKFSSFDEYDNEFFDEEADEDGKKDN